MTEPPDLEPPDTHYLRAAEGWIELGNPAEALAELDHVRPANQKHPDVFEVRWEICAGQKDWPKALTVARTLLAIAPDRASGWLHQAYALRRVPEGGLPAAHAALLPAFAKFPREPVIPFNLACYACQMHRLDEAREWFRRAAAVGGKPTLQAMALADPDLEPLWSELAAL